MTSPCACRAMPASMIASTRRQVRRPCTRCCRRRAGRTAPRSIATELIPRAAVPSLPCRHRPTIGRSLSNTFAGIRPQDVPGFIARPLVTRRAPAGAEVQPQRTGDVLALLRKHTGLIGVAAPIFDSADDLGQNFLIACTLEPCDLCASTEIRQ